MAPKRRSNQHAARPRRPGHAATARSAPRTHPADQTASRLTAMTDNRRSTVSPPRGRLSAARSAALATIVLTAIGAGCASDTTTPPVTTSAGGVVATTPVEGGAGVPLEPGSNLPPDQLSPTPADTTGNTSDPLAPSNSDVEGARRTTMPSRATSRLEGGRP